MKEYSPDLGLGEHIRVFRKPVLDFLERLEQIKILKDNEAEGLLMADSAMLKVNGPQTRS